MEEPERYCAYQKCKKLLVRRAEESNQNWGRRKTCDKRCAALHRQESLKGQKHERKPVVKADKRKCKTFEVKPPIDGLDELMKRRMMRGALR